MKLIAVVLACLVTSFLSACNSAAITNQTPAQLIATIHTDVTNACNVVQPSLNSMKTMEGGLTADQIVIVDKVYSDVTTFCSSRSTISVASVADFANTAIPAGLKLVNASSLTQSDKTLIAIAVMVLQGALNSAVTQYNSAIQTVPASAPVAASA